MPDEVAVAVPDRERIAALLGVLDPTQLTADVDLAVEHELASVDAHEALLLVGILPRVDRERSGDADERGLTTQQGVRALHGPDERERREDADDKSGGEDAPVAARQHCDVEHDDATGEPVLPFISLDPQREVLRQRPPLLGAQERHGARVRSRADARLPTRQVAPGPVRTLLDEAAARRAAVAHGWTIVS